jgi:O-antigen/teichoic acid export membrane protein
MSIGFLKSSVVQFIVTKYIGYGLQIIVALLTAKYLGLFYFGIYGFVNLALQYLSYSNMGVQYSLNVLLSTDKVISIKKAELLLSNAIVVTITIGVLILILMILGDFSGLLIHLDKYLFHNYFILLLLISLVQSVNNIFINIYRLFNKLNLINFSIILPGILALICLAFFKEKNLFYSLLGSILISQIIILILFFIKSPVQVIFKFDRPSVRTLINKGFYLLIYNLSFYLILLTARSLVSYNYKVEDFALFNFANSLTMAVMMLIGSIGFLIFPKMLNKFSNLDEGNTIHFMEKSRKIYLTSMFFIVYLSLAFLPLVFKILPNYRNSINTIVILLVSQLILENCFGYSALLIQRGKEKILTVYGYISVGIVLCLGIVSTWILNMSYEYVAVAVLLSVILYSHLVIRFGIRESKQDKNTLQLLGYIYNYKYYLPLAAFTFLYFFTDFYFAAFIISIVVFIILNISDLIISAGHIKNLLINKESLQISSEV